MARIAILAPNLSKADAVTNDVLGMSRMLKNRGHDVQLFASDWNLTDHEVRRVSTAGSFIQSQDDVLIYHHSIGWDGYEFLKQARCRTVIKYHNITPPAFFEGISEKHKNLCAEGRRQLKFLARAEHDAYLAASAYNMRDLRAEGTSASRTSVVPPFHNADKLETIQPDLDIVDRYADGNVNILMVGGLRPNKGHVSLIETFAAYRSNFNSHARLLIVGAENEAFQSYTETLRELIELLLLKHRVVFTGEVSESELKAYYLVANALLVTSEHEGFCVPLVEAMALKVPIIGFGTTAIPETAGNAGVIWHERDATLLAESINYLVHHDGPMARLCFKGRQRYEQLFSNEVIEQRFLAAMTQAGIAV